MEANFILNSFRSIVAVIDSAIYSLIGFLYEIMMTLSKTSLFTDGTIDDFARRVYTLLGLIMVFKVTFSLLNYLVNPDMINDKTQGAGNIAKNIVITLILIIIVPYVFDFGYRLQKAILDDNVIAKIILGEVDTSSLSVNMDSNYCEDSIDIMNSPDILGNQNKAFGRYISLMTFRPFYSIDRSVESTTKDTPAVIEYCNKTSVSQLLSDSLYKADEGGNGFDQNNIGLYIINYQPILSTAAGVVVLLMMITLCMDVAVRAIKLGFLEIIAPVPIISYIDPKSGKDGIFKKWYREVFKTWASLFVKLAAIHFAVYIIALVGKVDIDSEYKIWIMLFLVIGALMFAKQFTKLIEDIFGIKLDGMSLHPIKKIQEQAVGGKQLTGLGGAAVIGTGAAIGGLVANNINNYKRLDDLKKDYNGNKLKIAGKFASQSLSGLGYGALRGIQTGYKSGKDGKLNFGTQFLDAVQQQSADRNLDETLIKQTDYKSPFVRTKYNAHNKWTDVIGQQGASGSTDELKNKLKALSAEKMDVENEYKSARETLSRLKSNESNLFTDVLNTYGNPFERKYKLDANGHPSITKSGALEYEPIQSYQDYIKSNPVTFGNAAEADEFRREYERWYTAESSYRNSINRMREIEKTEGKLTKDQEKMTGKKS